jgi:SAM-dependent methyltransferase
MTEITPDVPPDRRQHREWLINLAALPDGGVAVDLGCGRGDDLLALAERYRAPTTRFVGLDASRDAVTAARSVASDARVAFDVADLDAALPFADASVDLVFSQNLVECLADRERFVREVARVLRPGGVAVIAHWDFDTQVFDGADKALVRRLVHAYADLQQAWMRHADGWTGRRLHGLFFPTGLFDGEVHARVLTNTRYEAPLYGHGAAQSFRTLAKRTLVTAGDVDRFLEDLAALHEAGRYFYSITGYAYVGRRCEKLPQATHAPQ